jgi:integrase
MRGVFRWAHKAGHIKHDPTTGIETPARPRSEGFKAWDEDDVLAYERRWPIGTRQRVWLDVLLYTGLRRGDAARLGRQHVRDNVARLKTQKTDTPVALPILPVLAQTLAAGPCGDLTFIAGAKGRPLTKESFGNEFREACRAAGINKSAHGLRKIAGIRCAQNGATVPQMNAIFGWTGAKMALHYIELANREKMAADAMHLMNENRTSIVAPEREVRHLGQKDK